MEKKKVNYFWWIISALFLIFLAYTIAYESGYYEANISRKSKITEEKMEEFEQDVKDGKEIDIKDYVENDFVDYSSSMSKIGNKLASSIDSFMQGGLSDFFELLGKLFT
ncbi:MAG: hypothetical protein IJ572_00955 [Bacilli bacterium]|nr:hypothetical protein [Bacilli bacterium]